MLLNTFNRQHNPDILECIANLSSDEVFTPPDVANKILDLLPKEVWSNPELKFLDPACKTGIFLRECARRLMVGLEKAIPDEEERRKHIFKEMLYGIAITDITSLLSRRSLYYSKTATNERAVVRFNQAYGNIEYKNIRHTIKAGQCIYCGAPESYQRGKDLEYHAYQLIHEDNPFKNMKFDVIVGNPPYQLKDGGGGRGSSAMPIYHKFIEAAISQNPRYLSMIIPSRWFAGGKGLDEFRTNMLADKRMKVLVDYPNAEDCFPGVAIKGGVCYFLWDSKHNGACDVVSMRGGEEVNRMSRDLGGYDVLIRFNESIDIINKIAGRNELTLEKKVFSRNPFGLHADFSDFSNTKLSDSVKVYARSKIGWTKKRNIRTNESLVDKYKVLISKAYGAGNDYPHQITGLPILSEKGSCCTETYLVMDVFDNKERAENFMQYIKTRFFRFLVSVRKNTQNMSKSTFSFVPDLDMSQEWTDKKLYKRYDITEEEQEFIESIVREMK